MPDDVSALQLLLRGDPALLAIVRLSLLVSLSAVVLAGLIGVPLGAGVALTRFAGREVVIVVLNALMGLPPVVVGLVVYLLLSRSGPLGSWGLLFTPQAMIIAQTILVAPIIAALTRQTVEDLWSEYREELAAMDVGPFGRDRDLGLGRPLQPDHCAARGLRPRGGGGRRHPDRGRQYRRLHPHHDHGDRARNLEGRPAARHRTRRGADRHRRRGQRRSLGAAACRRTICGMTMRAPATDLPIMLEDASFIAGGVTILERISLALGAGRPTVLIGPNGAGKTTLLRLVMGLISPPTDG